MGFARGSVITTPFTFTAPSANSRAMRDRLKDASIGTSRAKALSKRGAGFSEISKDTSVAVMGAS
jgi:hypothetical protein